MNVGGSLYNTDFPNMYLSELVPLPKLGQQVVKVLEHVVPNIGSPLGFYMQVYRHEPPARPLVVFEGNLQSYYQQVQDESIKDLLRLLPLYPTLQSVVDMCTANKDKL